MDKEILGFYKNYMLVKGDNLCFVTNRTERKIIFQGDEESASKFFTMLIANFINEKLERT